MQVPAAGMENNIKHGLSKSQQVSASLSKSRPKLKEDIDDLKPRISKF